jgi:hypothetical protein
MITPHLHWLTASTFTPFDYVYLTHSAFSLSAVMAGVASYLLGGLGYVALPLAAYWIVARPDRHTIAEVIWPSEPDRRLLTILVAGMLLLPALSAPFLRLELTSLWTMQGWFLLPIILLAPPAVLVPRPRAVGLAAAVLVITLLALLAAPAIAWTRHLGGSKHSESVYRQLSAEVTREWHRYSDAPLAIVLGDYSEAVAFYSPDHPDVVPFFNLNVAPWVTPGRLAREGFAVICGHAGCPSEAARLIGSSTRAAERDVMLSRRYLGRDGPSEKFFITIVLPVRTGTESGSK